MELPAAAISAFFSASEFWLVISFSYVMVIPARPSRGRCWRRRRRVQLVHQLPLRQQAMGVEYTMGLGVDFLFTVRKTGFVRLPCPR